MQMQITYWHLYRPQMYTVSGGGAAVSPPMLQRRDSVEVETPSSNAIAEPNQTNISAGNQPFTVQSPEYYVPYANGTRENNHNNVMELGDTSLFHNDEGAIMDMEVSHVDYDIESESIEEKAPIVATEQPEPPDGGDDGRPNGHYSEFSNVEGGADGDGDKSGEDEHDNENTDDDSSDDDSINEREYNALEKVVNQAKFILNLYPENRGYTYSCFLSNHGEADESHLIPYSERYLLDCIDNGVIPYKILNRMEEEHDIFLPRCRSHLFAEIRDFRRFSASSASSSSNVPVVREVVLHPTTESFLSDLDLIIEKTYDMHQQYHQKENIVSDDDESTASESSHVLETSEQSSCDETVSTREESIEEDEEVTDNEMDVENNEEVVAMTNNVEDVCSEVKEECPELNNISSDNADSERLVLDVETSPIIKEESGDITSEEAVGITTEKSEELTTTLADNVDGNGDGAQDEEMEVDDEEINNNDGASCVASASEVNDSNDSVADSGEVSDDQRQDPENVTVNGPSESISSDNDVDTDMNSSEDSNSEESDEDTAEESGEVTATSEVSSDDDSDSSQEDADEEDDDSDEAIDSSDSNSSSAEVSEDCSDDCDANSVASDASDAPVPPPDIILENKTISDDQTQNEENLIMNGSLEIVTSEKEDSELLDTSMESSQDSQICKTINIDEVDEQADDDAAEENEEVTMTSEVSSDDDSDDDSGSQEDTDEEVDDSDDEHTNCSTDSSYLSSSEVSEDCSEDCDANSIASEVSDSPVSLREKMLRDNTLSYDQRLNLEKLIVNATSESLCLDPNPIVGLIANRIQYERLKWNSEDLSSLKRKGGESSDSRPVKVKKVEESEKVISDAQRETVNEFCSFVDKIRARRVSSKCKIRIPDDGKLRLPPMIFQDYPPLDAPTKSLDEIKRLCHIPEPAELRSVTPENTFRKVEEYVLETERKKRSHTTKLSIFQRNGIESYFGELEMESYQDPLLNRLGKHDQSPVTKCQFELGSSSCVQLYVKQFSDIFTEDGRRPCKITYQKLGLSQPQVMYTGSYKNTANLNAIQSATANATNASSTSATNPIPVAQVQAVAPVPAVAQVPTVPVSASPIPTLTSVPVPVPVSVAVSVSAPAPIPVTTASQPPVQIVHPQPRSQPTQQVATPQPTTLQIYTTAGSSNSAQIPTGSQVVATSASAAAANVNFNVNVNSSGIVGISPQQVLTRPHILNVNLQQQQQQYQTRPVQIQAATTQHQLQQLAQQRQLRMKQQQQAQQQPTALAKLLLANVPPNNTSKPITVAVPPQPKNPNANQSNALNAVNANCTGNLNMSITSPLDHQIQNSLGSPIMIASPPNTSGSVNVTPSIVAQSPNVSVNVNASPNVSVNLNAISLDGLIQVSSPNYQTTNNLVTSNMNLGLNRLTTGGNVNAITPTTALNILRLNAQAGSNAGASVAPTLQRQLSVSNVNVNASNVSIITQQPRIVINSSTGSVVNSLSPGAASNELASPPGAQVTELEEIVSVPDLNNLLSSQQIQLSQLSAQQLATLNQHHLQQQQQTIQAAPQQLDGHNLNLNLSVNLNSGGRDPQHQIAKIQTGGEWATTNQAPPFLVFISPLRPLVATGATRQAQAVSAAPTLNFNLNSMQPNVSVAPSQSQEATILFESNCSNTGAMNASSLHTHIDNQGMLSSGERSVGVTDVESMFGVMSETMRPDLNQKLEGMGGAIIGQSSGSSNSGVSIVAPNIPQSRGGPSKLGIVGVGGSGTSSHGNSSVITLNDLLASPTLVPSSTNFTAASLVLNSAGNAQPGNTLLSPISISSTSPVGSSSLVSSTPRLSALLAGTPSADTLLSPTGTANAPILSNQSHSITGAPVDTSSYGNLLDRLAASLSQPQQGSVRTGQSRLNPIATATPNVVLEHPVLAATLTQHTPQPTSRTGTAYRQIAPAPAPNVHVHAQPQQLINLLGLVGNTGTGVGAGQPRTIRISANPATAISSNPSPGSGGMSGR